MEIRAVSSIFIIALVTRTSGQTAQGTPVSPCPSIFTYEPPGSEPEKWYGVVNLTTDTTLYSLWLNIVLDSKADILGNWVGEVTTEDNLDFKIENTKMTISPGQPLSVRFFIQYNTQNSPPRLKFIRFNGKELCNIKTPQVLESEKKSDGIVFGKHTTTTSKSIDRLQTTLKPQYWQQTKLEDSHQVKSENKQTNFWAPAKTEDKTTSRKNQQVNTESKTQSRLDDRSPSITVKKEQITAQLWSKPKVENSPQGKATDKLLARTETRPQNTTEDKSQPWPYTKVENQQSKSQDTNVKPENKYQTSWKMRIENASLQETKSDNSFLPKAIGSIGLENRQKTTTKKPQAAGNLEVIPKTRQEEVQEDKQNWSEEWLSNWSGDKSLSWNDQHQNKEDLMKADDSPIFTDDGRVKSLHDSSIGYRFQLNSEYPPPATMKPPIQDFDNDSPKKNEESFDYYFGDLPALYIPHHGRRIVEPQCGKVFLNGVPANSLRGTTTLEGQWPWQVALYQQQTTVDFKYICGGTLVSRRHIITAAHCVTRKGSSRVVNKNTLTVYLGKHNLRTSVDGVQVKFVNRILVPLEYNATTFKGDLAILELRGAITYSDWVQPACLWPENEDIKSIVGKRGSVVGWGFDITGLPREELRLLRMRVIDQETCVNTKVKLYADFYRQFTSNLTYCAGYNDGYSDCNGDSGGGMVIERDGIWYLRGVASLSVARQGEYLCDPDHYVIFTDIAKFLSWIEEYVDDY